ncbi:MAG TPA: YhjD/YihY/BrkB family envelope integrity protein [Nocardioides sp.]|nr:YhjD/YihY/BrkB family envelope integrity protein [Nocardioides sp.]
MGVVAAFDRGQRRHSVLGLPIAIFYKYVDDQGNYLAATITYYAFIAIFPLLLLGSSILGFILQNDPDLAARLLTSALANFPIVGDQLGRPGGLKGSVAGVVIGALAALYGSLGLGQALQNANNVAWAVPRNRRPNPITLRLRSLLVLVTTGLAIAVITTLTTLGTDTETFGTKADDTVGWVVRLVSVLVLGSVLTLIFRFTTTARRHTLVRAAPGAFATAVMFQLLQYAGTVYADRVIKETSGMNGTFALVLGLVGIIYLASVMGMLGIEVNVVLARRLWPRSLASLFTDNTDLTDADLRAYAGYARSQQHKTIGEIEVVFHDPDTGEIRLPEEKP